MLSEPILYFLATLIAAALFWSLSPQDDRLRRLVLLVVSMGVVFLYAPVAFLICLYLALLPLVLQPIYRRRKKSWLLWVGLAMAVLPLVLTRVTVPLGFFVTFGLAFATVRGIGLVMTAYVGRREMTAVETLFLIFFFPLYAVGPVERLESFAPERFQSRFSWPVLWQALGRMIVGLFVVYFVCGELLQPLRDTTFGRSAEDIGTLTMAGAWGLVLVSFLFTYLNFVGFTELAIGTSRLFGITVAENFDKPLLVTNIADFWKRYHMSMGTWINTYIYFPVVLLIKKPWAGYAGSVIAFTFFGLWHAFTWNYLVWGLGNGIALALYQLALTRKLFDRVPLGSGRLALGLIGGISTIAYVAFLQTFANLADFPTGLLLVARLLGG